MSKIGLQLKTWQKVKFKDFIKLQRGFDLPKQDRISGEYPVVASTAIVDYHNEYKAEPPCVTTGRSGALGKVLYINNKCWPLNTALWVKDFKGNNPYFVYCKLKILGLEQYDSGAGVPTLNRNHLDEIMVDVPPVPTQQKIADILSTYDNLIKNNTKRIKILEQMAQDLYKEWFVYFRFPGHEKVKLVESGLEFGRIPEGWGVRSFEELAQYVNGFAFKPRHWKDKGLPIVKIAELNNGISGKTPFYDGNDIPKKYQIESGDILFAWSASLGVHMWCSGQGFLNQHIFKVEPKEGINKWWLYLSLSARIHDFKGISLGATMQHIKRSALGQVFAILPDKTLLNLFKDIIDPVFSEVLSIESQNKILRQARDLLLPRLIGGEMNI